MPMKPSFLLTTQNADTFNDQLIGSAYPVVKLVAENLEYIKHVSAHLANIYRVDATLGNIDAINEYLEAIDTVYLNISSVVITANNMAAITNINAEIAKLTALFNDLTKLLAIHANLTQIDGVYDQLSEVITLNDNLVMLGAVHSNLTQLLAIHTNLPQLLAIYDALDFITDNTASIAAIEDLVTLSGMAFNAEHLGVFSGSTVADNSTIKTALQSLETAVETKIAAANLSQSVGSSSIAVNIDVGTDITLPAATALAAGLMVPNQFSKLENIGITQAVDLDAIEANAAALVTLTGVAANAVNLGIFTGSTIVDNSTVKTALQALETSLEVKIAAANLSQVVGASSINVNIDTGTDITLPAATGSAAGLMLPAQFNKLGFIAVTQAVDLDAIETNTGSLITLSGVAANAVNLGIFTGATIADNVTVKPALQALETAIETKISAANLAMTVGASSIDVTIDTGTDVTLPAATGALSGLMVPAQFNKLGFISVSQAVNLDNMESDITALVSLSGVASNSTNLGAFTGTTIADNLTVKAAIQALETDHEVAEATIATEATKIGNLVSLSGVATNASNLGAFTGTIIPDSQTTKGALQALETSLEASLTNSVAKTGDTMSGALQINSTLGVTGAVDFDSTLNVDGAGLVKGYLSVGDATTNASLIINGADATSKAVRFRTANLERWLLYSDTVAEAGSNVGSNFNVGRYSDAGASLGIALTINRASGITTFNYAVNVPTAPVNTDTTQAASTAYVMNALTDWNL